MKKFTYYTPTKVIFGADAELQAGEMLKAYGAKKVLVHYGSGSVIKSGLLDRVITTISIAGLQYVTLGGVVPNPLITKVYEGIELCRAENVDFILAVGGGSVIDSAKAIGLGLAYDGDVWDFYEGKATPKGCYPIGCVLTMAAAGSEMSLPSVITNANGKLKRSARHEENLCKFALLNPALTLTLPDYQTACGCVDVLMHTMERYFYSGENGNNLDITDKISEGLMRSVIDNSLILKKNPNNIDARSNIMWASSLSHNGLTGTASDGDWATHNIEHEISGLYDVAHGAGLSAIWGSWARYVIDAIPERLAKFATDVWGIEPQESDKATALKGIEAFEDFCKTLNMPITLSGLGVDVTDEDIIEMADKATRGDTSPRGTVKKLHKQDVINLLMNAK